MPADDAVDRTVPDVSLGSTVFLPYAEAGAGNDGQVARGAGALIFFVKSLVEFHRILNADEGVDTDAVSVSDEPDGLIGRHNSKHFSPCGLCRAVE